MCSSRGLILTLLGLLGLTSSAVGGGPPRGVYTAEPPEAIGRLIERVKQGEEGALPPLAACDAAAPYLRRALKPPVNFRRALDLVNALAAIEARANERSRKRYPMWLAGGRWDVCAELLVACPDQKDAVELADLTIPPRKRIGVQFLVETDPFPRGYPGFKDLFWGLRFANNPTAEYYAGPDLNLDVQTSVMSFSALVRADRCTTELSMRQTWFVAVRTDLNAKCDLRERGSVYSEWFRCVVLVNGANRLPRVTESLVICDGDVELLTGIERSVVIANGNIVAGKWGGPSDSYLAASGDIVLPNKKPIGNSVFHAGGTVTLGEKPKGPERVCEHQTALPFGVRFLDPAEFGLLLDVQKDGLRVRELEKNAPFSSYGVEVGDVITAIDDVQATSLPVFRRQLRRGLVAESVILQIRRGDLALTRVIFLDGIPIPSAPMPREVKN